MDMLRRLISCRIIIIIITAVTMQSVHVLGLPTFVFFQCMHAGQVGQYFNLRPNFEF